jgi:hypothetical protein
MTDSLTQGFKIKNSGCIFKNIRDTRRILDDPGWGLGIMADNEVYVNKQVGDNLTNLLHSSLKSITRWTTSFLNYC